MPRKTKPLASVPEEKSVSQSVEAPKEKKHRKPKVPESVSESVPTVPDTTSVSEDPTSKVRKTPTKESVEKEFDDLILSLHEEINKLRETSSKSKGVKFLRTINKRLKALKGHSLRVSKQRQVSRRDNTNSGFLKPVAVSEDLCKFLGANPGTQFSRVDVTKQICKHIKDNNLQNPTDKRQILVEKDDTLRKLLNYKKDDGPLTYYSLQSKLKNHYTSSTSSVAQKQPPIVPPVSTQSNKSASAKSKKN